MNIIDKYVFTKYDDRRININKTSILILQNSKSNFLIILIIRQS